MARVALIPTGRMEWEALADALTRLFPGNEFYAIPTREEVESKTFQGEFPISSFTSVDVTRVLGRRNNADKLVSRAAEEAMRSRRERRNDLVVILDDLELANLAQVERVVEGVREAAQRHLALLTQDRDVQSRTAAALREKVSFHLACPMIESWVFADPQGPSRAQTRAGQPARLASGRDPEDFLTADPDFVAAGDQDCTCWHSLPSKTPAQQKKRRRAAPLWVKVGADRERHPKAYMSWLAMDPTEPNCSAYQETHGGADALRALDWTAVLKAQTTWMPYLTALVNDLAEGLGQPPATGDLFGAEAAATGRTTATTGERLLRNM